MHITVGQNGGVNPLPSIIHLLWDLCPRGFGNLPYKLIRTVKGDKANGITSLLNSVIN